MKKTPLYDIHKKSGGRIVEFAGWGLPVMYSSIIEEHQCVRKKAGLFDISHMGEIIVKGQDGEKFLRKLLPTSIDKLEENKGMYSCFCNDKGGVIDDLFVFMISKEEYYLVVNAATLEGDLLWMKKQKDDDENIKDLEIIDVSDETAKIDLQGPESLNILNELFDDNILKDLKRFYFIKTLYKDKKIIISQTGYTGELGYEFFIPNEIAPDLWNELIEKGASYGIKPIGLGARDSLRLEACYSLYGHELDSETSPVESGIGWIVNSKDEYIGKEPLVMQKNEGAGLKTVALELLGNGIPRDNNMILLNNSTIGSISSGGFSPILKKGIALALVVSTVKIGDRVKVIIRKKEIDAIVVKKPFYDYNG